MGLTAGSLSENGRGDEMLTSGPSLAIFRQCGQTALYSVRGFLKTLLIYMPESGGLGGKQRKKPLIFPTLKLVCSLVFEEMACSGEEVLSNLHKKQFLKCFTS